MIFDILLSGASQGLVWGLLALGFFISFRILDFADMTCEGSITLGGAITTMLIWKGVNVLIAMPIAFLLGALAGTVTGILHTKLKIPPILSGILTMTALYSVNIHIMSFATGVDGTANLSLLKYRDSTVFIALKNILGISTKNATLLLGFIIAAVIAILYWFFGTELGCSIRATGNNEKMCRAQGISTDLMKILGLAIANGLIALSGSLLCQYQSFADVKMGTGSIVIGLASIIIGEAIFAKAKNFAMKMTGIIVGAVIYRIIVALVIYSGMPSDDLKLMTAAVVVIALTITNFKGEIKNYVSKLRTSERRTDNE
jgi:putative ABC transport system permease protein